MHPFPCLKEVIYAPGTLWHYHMCLLGWGQHYAIGLVALSYISLSKLLLCFAWGFFAIDAPIMMTYL